MTSEVRFCSKCGVAKPAEEFAFRYRSTGERQWACRSCNAAYKRAWYGRNRVRHMERVAVNHVRTADANRLRVWEYLVGHPCVDCGETDLVVLEFDHLRDKQQNVLEMVSRGTSWKSILAEIEKCQVRCANCHRRRTLLVRGSYRLTNGIIERSFREARSGFTGSEPGIEYTGR